MNKLVFLLGAALASAAFSEYKHQTEIFLDDEPITVYFNDGDTFKIIEEGELFNVRARLQGFNALESYGPVHSWGKWKKKELHSIARAATLNARRGGWHCYSNGDTDAYRRILVDCPDLSLDQISKGLAHAMIMDDDVDAEPLLKAQKKAMKNKVGMWKKGQVDYVLTSAHSKAEKRLKGKPYDRFVSTKTGLSVKRNHANPYDTCETVEYTPNEGETASAMVYIPFQRRYGFARIDCP